MGRKKAQVIILATTQSGPASLSPALQTSAGGWEEGFPEVVSGLAIKHGQDFTRKGELQLSKGMEVPI